MYENKWILSDQLHYLMTGQLVDRIDKRNDFLMIKEELLNALNNFVNVDGCMMLKQLIMIVLYEIQLESAC